MTLPPGARVDQLDCFLVHNPAGLSILPCWEAMVELKKKGYTKSIGATSRLPARRGLPLQHTWSNRALKAECVVPSYLYRRLKFWHRPT
jgi:aryl-alcohol dehydrogenase-like predicted oxidoreductase